METLYHFNHPDEIESLIERIIPPSPQAGKIKLGLRELMINAIEHGNLGIHYEEKTKLLQSGQWKAEILRRLSLPQYQKRRAALRLSQEQSQLVVEVTDDGEGFAWQPYLECSKERLMHSHGRGIALAHQFCFDSLAYSPEGNSVRATIRH